MLNEHTLDQLKSLRLDGMVRAITRLPPTPPSARPLPA